MPNLAWFDVLDQSVDLQSSKIDCMLRTLCKLIEELCFTLELQVGGPNR